MSYSNGQKIFQEKRKFHQFLNKSGLKLTSGRQAVFKEIMHAHGHFAAEELVKRCQRHRTQVSRATIYRSLRELREAGVIRETAFGEKHQHYEHVYDEHLHHHARCIHCSTIIEFPCQNEKNPHIKALERQGFKIIGHEMHFYGMCRKCQD